MAGLFFVIQLIFLILIVVVEVFAIALINDLLIVLQGALVCSVLVLFLGLLEPANLLNLVIE